VTKQTTSVYVEESTLDLIEEIATESKQREDVPEMSKSEVHRELLNAGIEESGELTELVDETTAILHQRERYIEKDAKLSSLRTGFEARCQQHMKKRFEAGIRTEDIDNFCRGLKRDAEILWPEDDERRAEAKDYVDRLAEAAKAANEATDFDALDPAEAFARYGTVAEEVNAAAAHEHREEIVAEAAKRFDKGATDPMGVARAIADELAIDVDAVADVIEDADLFGSGRRERRDDLPEVPARGELTDD